MFGFGKKKKSPAPPDFELPSFPGTVLSLLAKLRDPDIATSELAQELEHDPGLHVRVLKTVNSAAFGLSHKVGNIVHAVNLLGRGRLESLVLSVATQETLSQNNQADWLDMSQFWVTAARRAAVARGLAAELHPQLQSDVFTIGLLEDMAVPIMANREGDRYRELYQSWLLEVDLDLVSEETKLFGIDHATLGAQMAIQWGFPAELAEAIDHHHELNDDALPLSLKIAALIKTAAQDDDSGIITAKAQQLLGVDSEATIELIETVLRESQELAVGLSS